MSLLEVSHLRKTFNGSVVAVDDVSFHVAEGEIVGLVGPNGAGKTTTMTMLAGLLKPDRGTICLQGHPFDPSQYADRALLGMVPQNLAIYPDLTALENLRFFGGLYGLRGTKLKQRVDSVLDLTGLTDRADDLVKTFSGGMQRRLNFGVALLHQPRLVILDEPTVGVDPQSRSHLLDAVKQLCRDGVSVLYASHYMEEVAAICHRIAILDHGKLLECGTLPELLSNVPRELRLSISPSSPTLIKQLHGLAQVQPSSNGELVVTLSLNGHLEGQVSGTALAAGVLPRESRTQHSTTPVASAIPLNDSTGGLTPPRSPAHFDEQLRQVMDVLRGCGAELRSIESEEHNLERLFLKLTGNRLRD